MREKMTPLQEHNFEKAAERELNGHRGLQNGRDFRWNVFRFRDEDQAFKDRFDDTFPDAPGSEKWFEKKFGGKASCQ